jgi:hypothetical protein
LIVCVCVFVCLFVTVCLFISWQAYTLHWCFVNKTKKQEYLVVCQSFSFCGNLFQHSPILFIRFLLTVL